MPVVSRILQGRGIFLISQEMLRAWRCVVSVNVLQEPNNLSQNFRIQPERAFYGWATILCSDRVERQKELLFPYEEILRFDNEGAYSLSYLYCNFRKIKEDLSTLTGIPLDSDLKPQFYEPPYTEIRFVLYSTTILEIVCNYESLPQLCQSFQPSEQFKPDPSKGIPGNNFGDPGLPNPDANPSNPNPSGYAISSSYNPDTNDNGHGNPGTNPNFVILSLSGDANNEYNQRVPIDTFDYESQHVLAPFANRPFVVFQEFEFPGRPDLHAYTVRDALGNGYTIGDYAWYGVPTLTVRFPGE